MTLYLVKAFGTWIKVDRRAFDLFLGPKRRTFIKRHSGPFAKRDIGFNRRAERSFKQELRA